MRVKVEKVAEGTRPREVIVKIETLEGPEELVMDERSLLNDTIEVGYPVAQHEQSRLVELPTETASGTWRVWIDESALIPNGSRQEAAE